MVPRVFFLAMLAPLTTHVTYSTDELTLLQPHAEVVTTGESTSHNGAEWWSNDQAKHFLRERCPAGLSRPVQPHAFRRSPTPPLPPVYLRIISCFRETANGRGGLMAFQWGQKQLLTNLTEFTACDVMILTADIIAHIPQMFYFRSAPANSALQLLEWWNALAGLLSEAC